MAVIVDNLMASGSKHGCIALRPFKHTVEYRSHEIAVLVRFGTSFKDGQSRQTGRAGNAFPANYELQQAERNQTAGAKRFGVTVSAEEKPPRLGHAVFLPDLARDPGGVSAGAGRTYSRFSWVTPIVVSAFQASTFPPPPPASQMPAGVILVYYSLFRCQVAGKR